MLSHQHQGNNLFTRTRLCNKEEAKSHEKYSQEMDTLRMVLYSGAQIWRHPGLQCVCYATADLGALKSNRCGVNISTLFTVPAQNGFTLRCKQKRLTHRNENTTFLWPKVRFMLEIQTPSCWRYKHRRSEYHISSSKGHSNNFSPAGVEMIVSMLFTAPECMITGFLRT